MRQILVPQTIHELQPVKDCHGETKLEEKPKVVWRTKNIVVIPPAQLQPLLILHGSHPLRF
ncbi:hypothetical protein [Endozoicomonas sp. YOMI1]|uniref:hypothetical protein n=1 Tax=Endozoicomonas sp. YOMI1 TaxID=2828739 RepID=UPI0021496BB0|nr:hypothetical protein [Endozoicomonas sp. YOMI1]